MSLSFLPFVFAPHVGLEPTVLACLAESASLLLKAMNLKRQHVVGTTLGGSHTHTQSKFSMILEDFTLTFSAELG